MHARGTTTVVGLVLIVGMVIVLAGSVFAVGSMAVGSVQSEANLDQAESALAAYSDSASNGGATSLSVPDSGRTRVTDEARITVEVGSEEVLDVAPRSVVYEEDGRRRVFEAGAVFSTNGDYTTVVRAPSIDYSYESARQEQTLSLDVVSLEGSVDELRQRSSSTRTGVDVPATSGSVGDTVTVRVESEYADAWARYFREQTRATVDHTGGTDVVEATFPVSEPPATVDNSFTVDGSVGIGGGVGVASYDSQSTPGAGSVGSGNYVRTDDGDVVSSDGFSGSGSATIEGDLYVDDDFSLDGGTTVGGNIYATGNVTIATSTPIEDTIVAGGDVIIDNGGVNFDPGSEVRAAGDVVQNTYAEYGGTIHAGGNITSSASSAGYDSSASMIAGETASLSGNPDPSQVTEHASPPSTSELSRVDAALSTMPEPATEVQSAFDRYEESAQDVSLGGDNADDTLTAGTYHVDGDVTYGGDPSLTLDTTGGDVTLLIDGDVDAPDLDADVVGEGQVRIYVTGNFESTGDPAWTNPDGAGNRLFVYTAGNDTTRIAGDGFYGVVFSESDLSLNGGTSVYGAIVTNGSDVNGGQNVFFDQALSDTDLDPGSGGGGSGARRTYLHVTHTQIEGE